MKVINTYIIPHIFHDPYTLFECESDVWFLRTAYEEYGRTPYSIFRECTKKEAEELLNR